MAKQEKPKKVTVGRLKQVKDSLMREGMAKNTLAADFKKDKSKASQTLSKEFKKGSNADFDRGLKYDKIIQKATSKKKK